MNATTFPARSSVRVVLLGQAAAPVRVTLGHRWALLEPVAPLSLSPRTAWTTDAKAQAVARCVARSLARDGFARVGFKALEAITQPEPAAWRPLKS